MLNSLDFSTLILTLTRVGFFFYYCFLPTIETLRKYVSYERSVSSDIYALRSKYINPGGNILCDIQRPGSEARRNDLADIQI